MSELVEVELWAVVDEDGAYAVGVDQDEANEKANEDGMAVVRRLVRVTIKLPKPEPVLVAVELSAESGEAVVSVK